MCGAALIAPLAMAATSLISGKSKGVQSYNPQEVELAPNNPTPETQDPTLGVDNTDATGAATKKGKSALVIQRNPSVGVSGASGGSGVAVAQG